MRTRPIAFNAAMVQEILAGKKTATRRIVASQPNKRGSEPYWNVGGFKLRDNRMKCPHGATGDRLWVRETTHEKDGSGRYADGKQVLLASGEPRPWWYSQSVCPSMHMPKAASRIVLEITAVGAEWLQGITESGARSEGFARREEFARAWDVLFAKNGRGFDADPLVWAIQFKLAGVV
jgi:hypothetical protein